MNINKVQFVNLFKTQVTIDIDRFTILHIGFCSQFVRPFVSKIKSEKYYKQTEIENGIST